MKEQEQAAMVACELEGWVVESIEEGFFYNKKKNIFEPDITEWVELARKHHIGYRRGWRYFECDECCTEWFEPSRDCYSHSGENCPNCSAWIHPYRCRQDLSLPVDEYCNLTKEAYTRKPKNVKLVLVSDDVDSKIGNMDIVDHDGKVIGRVHTGSHMNNEKERIAWIELKKNQDVLIEVVPDKD